MRQNELECPRCGFETGLASLTIALRGGADACPLCDRVLLPVVIEGTFDTSLRRMGQENPTLFDYLIERKDRRAARRRTVRWVDVLVHLVLLALLAYLLFRRLL